VSRDELVQRYLDGQLSRRVFIRRLIATGVSAGAALSYAGLLESAPAHAVALADFYLVVSDFTYAPNPAVLAQGQRVEVANFGAVAHDAADTSGMKLYNTGRIDPAGIGFISPPPGAGTYPYHCTDTSHVAMQGRLRVPVVATPTSGAVGSSFTIRWAVADPPTGFVFDVQRKAPGASTWTDWRVGVTARKRTAIPTRAGTWSYRARVRKLSNNTASGWSAPAAILVT
jgi:plastocyanin